MSAAIEKYLDTLNYYNKIEWCIIRVRKVVKEKRFLAHQWKNYTFAYANDKLPPAIEDGWNPRIPEYVNLDYVDVERRMDRPN